MFQEGRFVTDRGEGNFFVGWNEFYYIYLFFFIHTKDRNWMEILYAEEYQPGRKVVNFFWGVMVLGLFEL